MCVCVFFVVVRESFSFKGVMVYICYLKIIDVGVFFSEVGFILIFLS